jgi:hypothetical protein
MVLGKREKLKEFQPRVLALHKRVRGGTKLDGTAVLAALSYIGNLEVTDPRPFSSEDPLLSLPTALVGHICGV